MTGGSPAGPRRTVAGRPNFVGRCDPTVREHSGLPAQVSLRRSAAGSWTTRSPARAVRHVQPRRAVDCPSRHVAGPSDRRPVSAQVQIAGTQAERSDGRSGAWAGTTGTVPVPEGLVHPAGSTWTARPPGSGGRLEGPSARRPTPPPQHRECARSLLAPVLGCGSGSCQVARGDRLVPSVLQVWPLATLPAGRVYALPGAARRRSSSARAGERHRSAGRGRQRSPVRRQGHRGAGSGTHGSSSRHPPAGPTVDRLPLVGWMRACG